MRSSRVRLPRPVRWCAGGTFLSDLESLTAGCLPSLLARKGVNTKPARKKKDLQMVHVSSREREWFVLLAVVCTSNFFFFLFSPVAFWIPSLQKRDGSECNLIVATCQPS